MAATFPLRDFKEILKESLQLFSRHWLRLLGIALVSILPILSLFYLRFYMEVSLQPISSQSAFITNQVLYFFILTVVSLYSFLGTGAMFIYINAAYQGKRQGIIQSYKEAVKVYPKYLWINAHYAGKVFLWGLALIFPGMYFGVLYNYAPLAVLLGHRPAKEAIVYSATLVRPHIVKYLDYLLFAFLTAAVCSVPFVVIFDFMIERFYERNLFRMGQIFDFLQIMTFLVAFQFVWIFYYVIFETLRKSEKG